MPTTAPSSGPSGELLLLSLLLLPLLLLLCPCGGGCCSSCPLEPCPCPLCLRLEREGSLPLNKPLVSVNSLNADLASGSPAGSATNSPRCVAGNPGDLPERGCPRSSAPFRPSALPLLTRRGPPPTVGLNPARRASIQDPKAAGSNAGSSPLIASSGPSMVSSSGPSRLASKSMSPL